MHEYNCVHICVLVHVCNVIQFRVDMLLWHLFKEDRNGEEKV